jgi:hypothetical protein
MIVEDFDDYMQVTTIKTTKSNANISKEDAKV